MPIESPSFYLAWLWDQVKETYYAMPGPWWVKFLIVAICLAIPGPGDEALLLLGLALARKRRRRKELLSSTPPV
jgi:hypothetical protein